MTTIHFKERETHYLSVTGRFQLSYVVEKVLKKTLKVKGEKYFANKETEILKHNRKDQEGGKCVCVCVF